MQPSASLKTVSCGLKKYVTCNFNVNLVNLKDVMIETRLRCYLETLLLHIPALILLMMSQKLDVIRVVHTFSLLITIWQLLCYLMERMVL